mmetsp:Transcript_38282/g.88823  ORF Transcript_38282/g.88823 Transcript_38282/m.88823 type:complete len:205 (-) Transcript_38282:360-974(-)
MSAAVSAAWSSNSHSSSAFMEDCGSASPRTLSMTSVAAPQLIMSTPTTTKVPWTIINLLFLLHQLSSSSRARSNAIPPLRPPSQIINWYCQERSVGSVSTARLRPLEMAAQRGTAMARASKQRTTAKMPNLYGPLACSKKDTEKPHMMKTAVSAVEASISYASEASCSAACVRYNAPYLLMTMPPIRVLMMPEKPRAAAVEKMK